MTTCLHKVNPRGGFQSLHSSFCAIRHMDGEIELKVTATKHVQSGTTKERPNGIACMNVCNHHADYGKTRDNREQKRNPAGLVVTDKPLVDPNALVFTQRPGVNLGPDKVEAEELVEEPEVCESPVCELVQKAKKQRKRKSAKAIPASPKRKRVNLRLGRGSSKGARRAASASV